VADANKHKIWLILSIVIVILIIGFIFIYPNVKKGLAGQAISNIVVFSPQPGEMGINPFSATANPGDYLTVTIRTKLKTGEKANSVKVGVVYDSTKLEFIEAKLVPNSLLTKWPLGHFEINSTTLGKVLLSDGVVSTSPDALKLTGTVSLFSVKFKIKPSVSGQAIISLTDPKVMDDQTNLITTAKKSTINIVKGACILSCTDKTCGADGCGGSCGSCAGDQTCQNGNCVEGTSGTLTVTPDLKYPASFEIKEGSEAPVLKASVSAAGGEVKVTKVIVYLAATNIKADKKPTNVYLYYGKQKIAENGIFSGSTPITFTLTSPLIISPNTLSYFLLGAEFPSEMKTDPAKDATVYFSLKVITDPAQVGLGKVDGKVLKVVAVAACVSDCTGKTCGSDGCGGSCGSCAGDQTCSAAGTCIEKKCTLDAECGAGFICESNKCVQTTPLGGSSVISVSSCATPTEGWQSGNTYKLSTDVTTTDKKCFSISGVKDIVFDCDGYKIVGGSIEAGNDNTAAGIYLNKVNSSVIKNCKISTFSRGIYLLNSKTNTLLENTLSGTKHGIYLYSSTNTIMNNNNVCGNSVKDINCGYSNSLSGTGNKADATKVLLPSTCGLMTMTFTACDPICTPSCTGKTCGDDGCGGVCGSCVAGQTCSAGKCAVSCNTNADCPITCEGTKGKRDTCNSGVCGGTTEIWLAPECAENVECTSDAACGADKKCESNKCVQSANLDIDADGVTDSLEPTFCQGKGTVNAVYTSGNLNGCPLGDLDGNGDFDDKDAISLGEAYVNSLIAGDTLWIGFDLNCDGTVDEKDAILIGESYVNKLLGTGGDIVKCSG